MFGNAKTNNTATGGMFGATSNTATGGMFGGAKTTTGFGGGNAFGAASNTATGGGLFGGSTKTNTGTTGGGLFGNNTTNNTTSGGLFGAATTNKSGGLFNSTTSGATGGGLFGGTKPAGGGLFGNTSTSGGLFGNTGGNAMGGGLGTNMSMGGGLGNNMGNNMAMMGGVNNNMMNMRGGANMGLMPHMALMAQLPRGRSSGTAITLEENIRLLKSHEQNANLDSNNNNNNKYQLNQTRSRQSRRLQMQQQTNSPIRPRSIGGTHYVSKNVSQSLFDDTQINQVLSPDMFRRRSARHLTIEDDDDNNNENDANHNNNNQLTTAFSPSSTNRSSSNSRVSFVVDTPATNNNYNNKNNNNNNNDDDNDDDNETKKNSMNFNNNIKPSLPSKNPPTNKNNKLSTNPPLPDLQEMTDEQLSSVNGFEVIHSEHGSIKWIDAVDLRGLELDKIVYIGDGSIFVYHDDELPPGIQLESLPKTGNGLNKRAMLTMNNIFPESDEDDLQEYENELKKYNENLGFKFKSYEPRTGQWMFLVPHFNM
jgi:nuclear pore complex protein Nup98-Nup96